MNSYFKAQYLDYLRKTDPKAAKEWEDRVAKYFKLEIILYAIVLLSYLIVSSVFKI